MTQAYNLSQLANFVNTSGQLDALTGLTNTSSLGFPSGTRMSFNQTAAPTGWTKQTSTTINDSLLRFVTGATSSGGSVAFSTFNSGTTTGATTLTTSQMPSHNHNITRNLGTLANLESNSEGFGAISAFTTNSTVNATNGIIVKSAGGGTSHTHSSTTDIKYIDFIIAQKD